MKYRSINRIRDYGVLIYCYSVSNYQYKMAYEYNNILKKKRCTFKNWAEKQHKGSGWLFSRNWLT